MPGRPARVFALALGLVALAGTAACGGGSGSPPPAIGRGAGGSEREAREVDEALGGAAAPSRDGLAAAIALDVSGSMDERVRDERGRRARKIDVARRAARDLVEQFARYAAAHPDEPVLLGLYEFSRRDGQPDCREIVPLGPPERTRAEAALSRLEPRGGTPIGQAMVTATRALRATGLSRQHLLVVSDGENTDGLDPEAVAAGLARQPEGARPAFYFIAFDVDERRFTGLRDAGALLLSAADGAQLNATLDMLLQDTILVEK